MVNASQRPPHKTRGRNKQNQKTGSPLIHFENVGLRYGMGPEILRDMTFDIPKGSFQFLTGPSGAGKTTLLRLLFMSLQPTRGLIRMFNRDLAKIPRNELPMLRRRVGIVFQDFRLLDHLTTYENVALPLRVRGKEESSYRGDVIELLKWVGLGERINVLPPVLSGGEKQRAAIARALMDQPEILLADEPTGNVDPPMAKRLLNLFLELNRLGTAVVIATHDLGLMDQVNARRMILTEGRLDLYE
jgi:cell division transport system ATP-binding protein